MTNTKRMLIGVLIGNIFASIIVGATVAVWNATGNYYFTAGFATPLVIFSALLLISLSLKMKLAVELSVIKQDEVELEETASINKECQSRKLFNDELLEYVLTNSKIELTSNSKNNFEVSCSNRFAIGSMLIQFPYHEKYGIGEMIIRTAEESGVFVKYNDLAIVTCPVRKKLFFDIYIELLEEAETKFFIDRRKEILNKIQLCLGTAEES